MTANRLSLIEDATAAGYTVQTDADGTVKIIKRVGRWKKAEGVVIHADGVAFDVTVDCGVAKGIQSYKTMRKILGI